MTRSSQQTKLIVTSPSRTVAAFRVMATSTLTTIGCLALVVFTVTHWLEGYILNTDAWVETVAPLPKTPVVNSALSSYVTGLVFENINVEQEIENVLPPKAAFVAGPLADQLHSLTVHTTQRVLQGDAFQAAWSGANRLAMNRLLTNARSPSPPKYSKQIEQYNLDLSGVKDKLASRLGTTASGLPSLSSNSGQSFRIGVNLQESRERLWRYIRLADFLAVVLPFFAAVAFLGALDISHNRRKTLLIIAVVSFMVLLLELIALKAVRQGVLDKVQHAQYQNAIGYIFDTITSPLHSFVVWLLVPCLLIILTCTITGPTSWAVALRDYIAHNLSFSQTIKRYWLHFRLLARRYQLIAWGGIGLLLLIWLAFISGITARTILKDFLIALSLAELVFLVAHPRPVKSL